MENTELLQKIYEVLIDLDGSFKAFFIILAVFFSVYLLSRFFNFIFR